MTDRGEAMLDFCFINGKPYAKNKMAKISWQDYVQFAQNLMPKKLYKYFPNVINADNQRNYSKEALRNNTVFLNTPMAFDDPYDSSLCMDEQEFRMKRLQHYAKLCGFSFGDDWDFFKLGYEFSVYLFPYGSNWDLWESVFHLTKNDDNSLDLTHEAFASRLFLSLHQESAPADVWQRAFAEALHKEFEEVQNHLAGRFRIACFTTTPASMLMWSHYANSHKGFCVEYDVPALTKNNVNLLQHLFPVIYSDQRVSVLEPCLADLSCPTVTEDIVWPIYKHGLLTKSLWWGYQNEWRLISLDDMLADQPHYNCTFFPISKVFLGAKMDRKERKEIIKICEGNGIPSTCVLPTMDTYNMQECTGKKINPNCVYKELL